MNRRTVIFAGYLARYPMGGHVLAELSCVVGLQKMGFDIFFVEGCGMDQEPFFDPVGKRMTQDPARGIETLRAEFAPFGMEDSWCLIDSAGQSHGCSRAELAERCESAEFLFSRAGTSWSEEMALCRKKIYLDVDPGFTQFRMSPVPDRSIPGYASPYAFDHVFTLATRIGDAECPIPRHGLDWKPTLPVFVPELIPERSPVAGAYTTVMSWNAYGEEVYRGKVYGQKSREMHHIARLPQDVPEVRFEMAVASAPKEEKEKLTRAGWHLINPAEATANLTSYLEFIASSRGEISVAKHGYVASKSGWLSDRTMAFLATGRPAIVQDTSVHGLDMQTGPLRAFSDAAGAVRALRSIEADYEHQAKAARLYAHKHFHYRSVLGTLLREAEVPVCLDAEDDFA